MSKNFRRYFGLFCYFVFAAFTVEAQVLVKQDKSPHNLVFQMLLGNQSGLRIDSVNFIGDEKSLGAFYSGTKQLPISKGLVMSTGMVSQVDGPNESTQMGEPLYTPGYMPLAYIAKAKTADAAVLSFVFYPSTDEISFEYFFASEEYPEYIYAGVNDVFAFFIEGPGFETPTNIALIPGCGDAVSVDNVNESRNRAYHISNPIWSTDLLTKDIKKAELSHSFAFDGLTTKLLARAKVIPYQRYVLTIAIADVGDNIYDSGVFLKAKSLGSKGSKVPFAKLIKSDLDKIVLHEKLMEFTLLDSTVRIISNVEFEYDSHVVLDENYEALNSLVALLNQYFEVSVKVIGHTDDKGSDIYNNELSYERANSIKKYLIQKGISSKRFLVEGKGKKEPLVREQSSEARAKNRRVEFILY